MVYYKLAYFLRKIQTLRVITREFLRLRIQQFQGIILI